jgi:hypothetical protein
MRGTVFVLLFMLLLILGCSNDEHNRKIVGKWKGEKTGIVAELLSDGTLIFNDQPGHYKGIPIKIKWKYLKEGKVLFEYEGGGDRPSVVTKYDYSEGKLIGDNETFTKFP